jgi:hypothetical protein
MHRFGLEASERLKNVGSIRTVAVCFVFSGGLLIRPQIRRPTGAHNGDALATTPYGHDQHGGSLTAARAVQSQAVEAARAQVMPVARIDQPLAAAGQIASRRGPVVSDPATASTLTVPTPRYQAQTSPKAMSAASLQESSMASLHTETAGSPCSSIT